MHNNKYLKENPNPNPNPNQPLLAYHFIQALTRINLAAHTTSTKQRTQIIKHAAYVSMAFAAGNKRTWTHAVLHNKFPIKTRFHRLSGSRRSFNVSLSRNKDTLHHALLLRSLVPGGHAMEFSSLLMETANYIQYLTAQVRLMQCIVEKFDMHV